MEEDGEETMWIEREYDRQTHRLLHTHAHTHTHVQMKRSNNLH